MKTFTTAALTTAAYNTANWVALSDGLKLSPGADSPRFRELITPDNLRLLVGLHLEFEGRRQELLSARKVRQKQYNQGQVPAYLSEHPAQTSPWQVAPIPTDLLTRRVEITGPANSAKMVIQMLSPNDDGVKADTAMIDFEDSMQPSWANVVDAIHNIREVASGVFSFVQKGENGKPDKIYRLDPNRSAHPMIRLRGFHLNEQNVCVGGVKISAALFDLVMCSSHSAREFLARRMTPKYYVPKTEHFLEARWWNDLFVAVEEGLEIPRGALRVTFLIETLPAAFQMEEILYEIRERACGLNGGRWDKIFSDIKTLRMHKDKVLADRSSITMKSPWMDHYVQRMVQVCHRHGAFAMGGMAAFTPGKDPETRQKQTEKVAADKAHEAAIGHDGCWVSHPYFITVAMKQFSQNNQLHVKKTDFPDKPDLMPKPTGPKTLQGLTTNIRVGIAYLQGWSQGIGCVAFDNLMEDLATLEISRAQTWQWLHHHVVLDCGTRVEKKLVESIFDTEVEKIIQELAVAPQWQGSYRNAAQEAKALFTADTLADFLTLDSPLQLEPQRRTHGHSSRTGETVATTPSVEGCSTKV